MSTSASNSQTSGESEEEVSEIISLSSDSDCDSSASDETLEVWKESLRDCLDGIKTTGKYATSQTYPVFPYPGIQIEGHPVIPLPLVQSSVDIIKSVCRQAPFGKGDQTVVDTSVRDTWELSPQQFQLLNPSWHTFINGVLQFFITSFGLGGAKAELYKMLLYEKGSFFKRHKDSEKAPGMIGTLVICLPSKHEGGDVHLSLGSTEQVLSTASTSEFDLTALAWFADVTHEVKKLTSGHRLVLTYNLIQTNSAPESALSVHKQSEALERLIKRWQRDHSYATMLVYSLEHQYTKSSLSIDNMKGRDFAVCQNLTKICSANEVYLFFGNLTCSEETDNYNDEMEKTIELEAVFTPRGAQVMSCLEVDIEDLLDPELFDGRYPDSEEEGEFWGNESMTASFRYHNTAIVLLPKERLAEYLTRETMRDNVDNMVSLVESELIESQDDPVTRNRAIAFMTRLAGAPRAMGRSMEKSLAIAVDWALKLKDDYLYHLVIDNFAQQTELETKVLVVIARHIVHRYAGNPEAIKWDKWLGDILVKMNSLTNIHRVFDTLVPLLEPEFLKTTFRKWRNAKIQSQLELKSSFLPEDCEAIVGLLTSPDSEKGWKKNILIELVISQGNRACLELLSKDLLKEGAKLTHNETKNLLARLLQLGAHKLALLEDDLYDCFTYSDLPSTFYASRSAHGYVYNFAVLVHNALSFSLSQEVSTLIEASNNNLSNLNSSHPKSSKRFEFQSVVEFLTILESTLRKFKVQPSPVFKEFFVIILRHRLFGQIPKVPPKPQGWTHMPHKCYKMNAKIVNF